MLGLNAIHVIKNAPYAQICQQQTIKSNKHEIPSIFYDRYVYVCYDVALKKHDARDVQLLNQLARTELWWRCCFR